MVFGKKDTVSKSWSDLWDEEEEEQEEAKQLETLKEMNSRTWSHDSKLDEFGSDDTPRQGQSPVAKSASLHIPSIETTISDDIDGDLVADGFFFQETPAKSKDAETPKTPYSPPTKRDSLDKWAALGQRRRGLTGQSAPAKPIEYTFKTHRSVKDVAPSPVTHRSSEFVPHAHASPGFSSPSPIHHHKERRINHHGATPVKERSPKDCPWNQGREHQQHREPQQAQASWNWGWNWRNKEKRVQHESEREVERVDGWQSRPVHHL